MHRMWTVSIGIAAVAVSGFLVQSPPSAAGQGGPPVGRQGGPPGPARGGGFFPRVPSLPFPTSPQVIETIHHRIRVVPHVAGLAQPWGIGFLPSGEMLVTEKAGRLRIVRNGVLDPRPVAGTPETFSAGQAALMEVLPHPRFEENRWLYLTYSKLGPDGRNTTALARGRFDGTALTGTEDIFVADAWSQGPIHFGSKLAWGRDGMLYMTVGERNERDRAQSLGDHAGKVLRLREDGSVPPDNPFVGRAGAKPEIYSYGHRNMQGLAVHPETGELWETEHGPQGGDELNIIRPGRNYGWPVITHGREYSGQVISPQPAREGMEQPEITWSPSIGVSGMAFYTGNALPNWKGSVFVGGLSGQYLQRVVLNDRGIAGREPIIPELRQRIREVRQGPDGFLYLAVDSPQGGILRIEPAD